jgi:hypothetical protein
MLLAARPDGRQQLRVLRRSALRHVHNLRAISCRGCALRPADAAPEPVSRQRAQPERLSKLVRGTLGPLDCPDERMDGDAATRPETDRLRAVVNPLASHLRSQRDGSCVALEGAAGERRILPDRPKRRDSVAPRCSAGRIESMGRSEGHGESLIVFFG